ncbi:hypothetical protein GF336_03860 [Candidatus Woesearchaeota archaeon]|nr:hypothetical protein [Candidatus Woesearchaeota archaeon]
MMNWRKPIIYSLLYLSGSNILGYLDEIKKIENYPEEKIRRYQERKLKKILLHACKNVPYYRKTLKKAEVVKNSRIDLENFENIPFLTKNIIRKQGKNIYSKDYRKRKPYENTSGGSTGEPVRFIQDKRYNEWNIANKLWIKLKAGQDIGDKELRFWGSERDLLEGKESLKIRLRNWLYNRKELNTFKMSKEDMVSYADEINSYGPAWIEAYVQSIYEFAKFIKKKNLKIHSPENGILTSAGTLYPDMRKLLEEVFRCKVYNRYGSREVGDMACGEDSLRLSFWNHFIEVINRKIYVTGLNNYSMPTIRYDMGDIGKLDADGFNLSKLEGREMSMLRTNSGKLIPPEFFIHFIGVVYNNNSIEKFQVIQNSSGNIKIKVKLMDRNQFEKDKDKIEEAIKLEMGRCNVYWDIMDDISATHNGKYEYVRREI